MAAFRNGRAVRKPWFVLLTLLAFGLAVGTGTFLWQAVQTSSVLAVQARIEALQPVLTMSRVLVIGLAALAWPPAVQALHRWGRIDRAGAARMRSLRWRAVTWLVVLELMLGQDLPGRFLGALQGTGA